MSLDAPFLSAFDRNQATKVAENKTNKNKEELKMKEGNTTAMLEQLRLREVALNSIFAKTGQKIRVKAVKARAGYLTGALFHLFIDRLFWLVGLPRKPSARR